MGAKFGPGGNSESFKRAGHRYTLEAPRYVKEYGLDIYEYEAGQGVSTTRDMLLAIGDQGVMHGVDFSFHTPYFISLSSVEPEKRRNSVGYILTSAEACSYLRANLMVVHTGSAAKITRETAMEYAAETLLMADKALDVQGFDTLIGLETMGKQNQLGTLDEVLTLCKLSPRFVPVVDFGHINAREQGILKTEDDFKRIFDRIATELSPEAANTLHCHFSCIEYTARGEKKHLTFADETYGPDYRPFIRAIHDLGISPTVICESAGTQAEDARTMKEYYQSL